MRCFNKTSDRFLALIGTVTPVSGTKPGPYPAHCRDTLIVIPAKGRVPQGSFIHLHVDLVEQDLPGVSRPIGFRYHAHGRIGSLALRIIALLGRGPGAAGTDKEQQDDDQMINMKCVS